MSEELQDLGAPSALKWIEKEEGEARARYEECKAVYLNACKETQLQSPNADPEYFQRMESVAKRHMDDAGSMLENLQKRLREFSKAVPEEKRDSSNKITQDEGERLLAMVAVYFRGGVEQIITSVCQDALACRTPEELHKLVNSKVIDCMKNAVSSGCREGHLPKWCEKSLEGVV